MRIDEVTNEAPVSGIRQGLRKVGAKALAKVGAKGTAMNIAGKVDAGDRANDLMAKFKGYLGRTGGNIKQVDANTLKAFLQSQKMPVTSVPASGMIDPKKINNVFVKVAQDSFKLSGDQPSAGAGAPGSGGAPAAGGTAPANAQGGGDNVVKMVPKELQAKIDKLTPAEKQQLVGML